MLTRRVFSGGVIAATGLVLAPWRVARAALEWAPFEWEPVERAHAGAIPIVVAVQSKDCGPCRAQQALLDDVLSEHSFVLFVRFRVDFDRQKDVVDQLNVKEPGTVLAYVCNEEIGRLAGDIDPAALRKLLAKTLAA